MRRYENHRFLEPRLRRTRPNQMQATVAEMRLDANRRCFKASGRMAQDRAQIVGVCIQRFMNDAPGGLLRGVLRFELFQPCFQHA